ncbi:MAG: hypothetical protein WED34_09605 [Planctomycetales bacterium]
MTIPLSAQQRGALAAAEDGPINVVDNVLQRKYVLLPAALYGRMLDALIAHGVDPTRLSDQQ